MKWISNLIVGISVTVAAQRGRAGVVNQGPGACQPVAVVAPLPEVCKPVHVYLPPPKACAPVKVYEAVKACEPVKAACEPVKACDPVHSYLSLERFGHHIDHAIYATFHKVHFYRNGGYAKEQIVEEAAPQAAPPAPAPARLPDAPSPSKP